VRQYALPIAPCGCASARTSPSGGIPSPPKCARSAKCTLRTLALLAARGARRSTAAATLAQAPGSRFRLLALLRHHPQYAADCLRRVLPPGAERAPSAVEPYPLTTSTDIPKELVQSIAIRIGKLARRASMVLGGLHSGSKPPPASNVRSSRLSGLSRPQNRSRDSPALRSGSGRPA
jgi:hypothetical protein